MEWWKLNSEDLNEEQAKAKQIAYYNTFYGTTQGRQVLLDLQKEAFMVFPQKEYSTAEAVIARILYFNDIKANCGMNVESEMAAIEAEGKAI